MRTSDDQLRELARTQLADYDYGDAINALIDIDDCTELTIPDDLLAQAARRHLDTIAAWGDVDPCGVLRALASNLKPRL